MARQRKSRKKGLVLPTQRIADRNRDQQLRRSNAAGVHKASNDRGGRAGRNRKTITDDRNAE